MRVTAIGVKRLTGTGKDSGKPFDFAQIAILRPVEVQSSQRFTCVGHGFEVSDLDLEKESINQFAGIKFPAQLDLVVDTVPGRQGLRSVVVGFKPVELKSAA